MLVEGEGLPQNDLDSCKAHLLVGSPSMILIQVRYICLLGIRHFRRKHFRRMHFRRRNIGRMEHWSNGTLVE